MSHDLKTPVTRLRVRAELLPDADLPRKFTQDDEAMEILFRDEGPGLAPQELARVFDPFYRVDASRSRDTGGTGLGLTIARGIAELHGGSIELRNRPDGGLEARLVLPRAAQARSRARTVSEPSVFGRGGRGP
jgi:signal transduction histidine kinase